MCVSVRWKKRRREQRECGLKLIAILDTSVCTLPHRRGTRKKKKSPNARIGARRMFPSSSVPLASHRRELLVFGGEGAKAVLLEPLETAFSLVI